METTTEITHLRACTDCLMLIANGETPPEMDEAETEDYVNRFDHWTEQFDVVVPSSWPFMAYFLDFEDAFAAVLAGHVDVDVLRFSLDDDVEVTDWSERDRYYGTDTESEFSMDGCDTCGSRLGGDRHPVAAWSNG